MKKPIYFLPHTLLFSAVMILLAITARRYDRHVFIFDLCLAVVAAIIIILSGFNYHKYVSKVVKDAARGIKGIDHTYLEKFTVPVTVTGKEGDLLWYNASFKRKLSRGRECAGDNIDIYTGGIDMETLLLNSGTDAALEGRRYTILATEISYGYVLFFIDDTDYKTAADLYNDIRPVVASVNLDNRDEFERHITDDNVNQAMIKTESLIKKWATSMDAVYVRSGTGRYKIIMDEKHLKLAIDTKFRLLEDIRSIKISDYSNETTISMGIGRGAASLLQSEQWSLAALDMALGRGGDQAAIKTGDDYEFFGGVAQGVEKHEKVQARVIAKALMDKLTQADNIYIMGHQSSDLDAVGSAVGMWSVISKTFPNKTNIVINIETSLARIFLDNFIENGYDYVFITPEQARSKVNEKTLLIIVDTHSPSFVDDPELYKLCRNVVVIDHHRMMVNHIDNASIFFHDPFASSASEMVTELVQYINADALARPEAEALLAGIMLDTKNFVLRTGVRTFEAAAFLKRKGADTVEVKRLFSDSLNTYKTKSRLVSEAEIYNNSAIACTDDTMNEDKDIRMTAAQAADELLTIQDVQASYVIYKSLENMCVSARSLGDVNVQLVMEKLGGGGHQTMAGANLGKISKNEAREKLVDAINKVAGEGFDTASTIKRRNIQ